MADRFDSGGQGDLGIEAELDSRHTAGAAGEAAPVPGAAVAPGTYVVSFTVVERRGPCCTGGRQLWTFYVTMKEELFLGA